MGGGRPFSPKNKYSYTLIVMTNDEIVQYWLAEAEESLTVADHLVAKKDYSYALFFGHLAVEKMLKALYVKRHQKSAIRTHDLGRLANHVGLSLVDIRADQFDVMTTFNLEARYPDYKRAFRNKCTSEYTKKWMNIIKENFTWLRSHLIS